MFSNRALLRATRASTSISQRVVVPRASLARSYATPAAADSKPPVALFGLDGTYASALVGYLPVMVAGYLRRMVDAN